MAHLTGGGGAATRELGGTQVKGRAEGTSESPLSSGGQADWLAPCAKPWPTENCSPQPFWGPTSAHRLLLVHAREDRRAGRLLRKVGQRPRAAPGRPGDSRLGTPAPSPTSPGTRLFPTQESGLTGSRGRSPPRRRRPVFCILGPLPVCACPSWRPSLREPRCPSTRALASACNFGSLGAAQAQIQSRAQGKPGVCSKSSLTATHGPQHSDWGDTPP